MTIEPSGKTPSMQCWTVDLKLGQENVRVSWYAYSNVKLLDDVDKNKNSRS